MIILLTNDDGIDAPGLAVLGEALAGLGEVYVAAPDREYSATSHAITLRLPVSVQVRAVPFPAVASWAVSGSPADCVKAAVFKLLPRNPDLVVSGINDGINVGVDILYSGTVAGAREGFLRGIPSLAVSTDKVRPDFALAAELAKDFCVPLASRSLGPATLLNLNVPAGARERGPVLSVTRQEGALFEETCKVEEEGGGLVFRFQGRRRDACFAPGSDCKAVDEGIVSVTALGADLNLGDAGPALAGLVEGLNR